MMKMKMRSESVVILGALWFAGLTGVGADLRAAEKSTPPPKPPTNSVESITAKNLTVVAGVLKSWPPQYGTADDGKPIGFAIEIMDAVAERARVEITYKPFDSFAQVMAALDAGRIDLIPNVGITAERARRFHFTGPVETFAVSIFTRRETKDVNGLADLDGRRVGVAKANVGVRLLAKRPAVVAVVHADVRSALFDLLSGRNDAVIYPAPVFSRLAADIGVADRIREIASPLVEIKRGIAVRNGDPALARRLNAVVRNFVKTPEYQRIYLKSYGQNQPYWTVARLTKAGIGFVLLMALMFGWHYFSVIELNRKLDFSKNMLRSLIDAAPAMLNAKDTNSRYVVINRYQAEQYGTTPQNAIGKTANELIGPTYGRYTAQFDRQVVETGKRLPSFEEDWKDLDGRQRRLLTTKAPIFDASGKVVIIASVALDITDRKAAEDELQRANDQLETRIEERTRQLREEIAERRQAQDALAISEQRFRDLAETASDWFWELDEKLRFTYVSPLYYEISGRNQEDIIGKTRLETMNQEAAGVARAQLLAHLDDMEAHRPFSNFVMQSFGGVGGRYDGETYYLALSGKPRFDAVGTFLGYRGTATDITDRHRAEVALVAATEQAERANRAKSEFLSKMSHELRTPLNAILGFGQLLINSPDEHLGDNQRKFAKWIMSSGDHLLELVNDLLDLAKLESGAVKLNITEVNPQAVFNALMPMVENMIAEGEVELENAYAGGASILVRADETRLKQVLLNLISNAVKYNKRGGRVMLSCLSRGNGMVRFEVRDTGCGISADQREKLFQPFNRLGAESSDIKGTGIGLTITKQLVELMGGVIDFESVVGEGSTFWIELPEHQVEGAAEESA